MFKQIKRYFWKRSYLRMLEHDAYRKEAMSFYSLQTIEDLKRLKAQDEWEKKNLRQNIEWAKQWGVPNTGTAIRYDFKNQYEQQKLIKECEKQIEAIDVRIEGRDKGIAAMELEAATLKNQSVELLHRVEIFKKTFKI